MKSVLSIVVLALTASCACIAQGWNDFELDIGDGYSIVKCNSLDICVCKARGMILYPQDYHSVGPVDQYFTTKDFIFTKNLGRKPRHLFKGDTFEDIDTTKEFFFIITKGSDVVAGPFTRSEFLRDSRVARAGPIRWRVPRNPNILLPLLGTLLFLACSIPILAIKYFWITLPMLWLAILVVLWRVIIKTRGNPPPS